VPELRRNCGSPLQMSMPNQSAAPDVVAEAAAATFLYDALLRGRSSRADVTSAASAYPSAAALAQFHARKVRDASTAPQTLTVSRISVVPCGYAVGTFAAALARAVMFVLAVAASVAMLVGLCIGEGETAMERVLHGLLRLDGRQGMELAATEELREARQIVSSAILALEEFTVSKRPFSYVPDEHLVWVVLAVYSAVGMTGGLVLVHGVIALAFAGGWLWGIVTSAVINAGLALSGGLRCDVTDRRVHLALQPHNSSDAFDEGR
jgi:hypothetical protein